MAKSLRRNEKPDYLKLMKKVICTISQDAKLNTRKSNSLDENVDVRKRTGRTSEGDSLNEDEIVIKIDKAKSRKRSDQVK